MPVLISSIVTYSPAYTIVPTYECFNRCTYCNFRSDPGQSPWLAMGFLPHTNAGLLSFAEMQQLKNVTVSMGLMLEQF